MMTTPRFRAPRAYSPRAALALLAIVSLSACTTAREGPAVPEGAGPHELVDRGATLLDVRTPAEYQSGHLEGALNIPVDDLEARMGDVPEGQSVVVYCRSGGRSARAATALRARGYEVHDLGAMSNWNASE